MIGDAIGFPCNDEDLKTSFVARAKASALMGFRHMAG